MEANADFFSVLVRAAAVAAVPAAAANVAATVTLPDYLMRLRNDKEWGGYPECVAVEELYDRPLLIFSDEGKLCEVGC
jgi:hypothetical protein